MKRILIFLTLMLPAMVFGQDQKASQALVDFTARDLKARKVQLAKLLENGPVLLDFWALWCVPCLKEMPHLDEIQEEFRKQGLTVVAINEDSPSGQSKVKPYVKQKRFGFLVVLDEDRDLWEQFKVTALPTTILIDQLGRIVYSHTGYKPGDEKVLRSKIAKLFTDRNAPPKKP